MVDKLTPALAGSFSSDGELLLVERTGNESASIFSLADMTEARISHSTG